MAQLQDPNESNVVQAHLLLPPPPPGHQTMSLVCPLTFSIDGASNHVLHYCLPSHINIMPDCVHTTLLRHFIGGWICPLVIRHPAWCVFLCRPIRRTDVESLKPGHDSWAQDPCLASVQEDRLHNGLVNLALTCGGEFSFCNTCQTLAHVPCALRSWLCMAWMSSSSCKSRRPRYLNTLTRSSTFPCTVNCWRKASADCTTMSRWCCLSVPTQHSFVLMCVRYRGSVCTKYSRSWRTLVCAMIG